MYARICPRCGEESTYASKSNYQRSLLIPNWVCKPCKRTELNLLLPKKALENNPAWKGYKEIPFSWFSKYFLRANKKRTGTITIEDVWEIYLKQGKVCALSGVPIGFNDDGPRHTASIDRKDSSKEYTLDNVQLVHKDINLMKNHFNQEYFITICSKIADHAMR